MADDVLVNRAAAIERAVARVREIHAGDDRHLTENQTTQDAIMRLQRMVGFRNIAIHEYQRLDVATVSERLDDFLVFARVLVRS